MARLDPAWTAASHLGDHHIIDSQSPSEGLQTVQKYDSGNLADMLTAMVEQSGQLVSEKAAAPDSPIKRLSQEFNQLQAKQLQSYVSVPREKDSLSHSMPSTSVAGRREDIGLRDLVEREIKAAQDLEQRRSQSIEPGSQYRSQSLFARMPTSNPGHSQSQQDRVDALMADPALSQLNDRPKLAGSSNQDRVNALLTDPALRRLNEQPKTPGASSQSDRVETLLKQVNHLQKELEKMEEALQHSTESELVALQELEKMEGEKAACAAAHAREIASLENVLTSIRSDNKTLKEALAVAMERSPQKLSPSGVPDDVERVMISSLIHSGFSDLSITSHSSGSASTETPSSEPEERARSPPSYE